MNYAYVMWNILKFYATAGYYTYKTWKLGVVHNPDFRVLNWRQEKGH